ncbi:MAG: long-chain fatty acid--CoA ligase [Rubrobacter sp.]|nr:long-chain fatty acid--CoA ligase [Rubrobacter sp.]
MNDAHFDFWPKRMPRSLTLPETSVFYNLEVSARRYPEKAAIVYYGSELSYRGLFEQSGRMAGFLSELGVSKGDRVVLYMQNSPQFAVAFYAVLRLGAVVVPINPMLTASDLEFHVEDSGAKTAFVGQELHPKASPLLEKGSLENIIVAAYSDYLTKNTDLPIPDVAAAPAEETEGAATPWCDALAGGHAPPEVSVGPDDMALLPYTSGTTGRPKGCVHTHRNLQATLVSAGLWANHTPNTVALSVLPLFHVTGMQHSMNAPVYYGGAIVLMTRWDKEAAAKLIEREGVTHWVNISTMVVDFLSNPKVKEYDLSTLSSVGGGGAPLPEAVGEKMKDFIGVQYMEGYGLSETISQTHFNPPDRPKLQCLGIPSFDVDARIIDPETFEERGADEEGEIVVEGPQVFQGYWNRPDEDEKAFIEIEGKRFFRTGDLGRRDGEGYFFMLDRLKRMINAGGYKVWPAEVESIMYRHPSIQEACVIGVPDERLGEAAKAFVVLRESEEGASADDIISWSREEMAAYKVPRRVEFVDALPKSGSGKILWRGLQEKERSMA